MRWYQRPKVTNFFDVDTLCDTNLTSDVSESQYGIKCAGVNCRDKLGNAPQNYIYGPVYLCCECPNRPLCRKCVYVQTDNTESQETPKSIEKIEITKDTVFRDQLGHELTKYWPAMFMQLRSVCQASRCSKTKPSKETECIITKDYWGIPKTRWYCFYCKETYCHPCGLRFKDGQKAFETRYDYCEDCRPGEICEFCLREDPWEATAAHPCRSKVGLGENNHHRLEQLQGSGNEAEDVIGHKEYKERLNNKTCFKCGGTGHELRDCSIALWKVPEHPPRDD